LDAGLVLPMTTLRGDVREGKVAGWALATATRKLSPKRGLAAWGAPGAAWRKL
jgi:hypothetical protein